MSLCSSIITLISPFFVNHKYTVLVHLMSHEQEYIDPNPIIYFYLAIRDPYMLHTNTNCLSVFFTSDVTYLTSPN